MYAIELRPRVSNNDKTFINLEECTTFVSLSLFFFVRYKPAHRIHHDKKCTGPDLSIFLAKPPGVGAYTPLLFATRLRKTQHISFSFSLIGLQSVTVIVREYVLDAYKQSFPGLWSNHTTRQRVHRQLRVVSRYASIV